MSRYIRKTLRKGKERNGISVLTVDNCKIGQYLISSYSADEYLVRIDKISKDTGFFAKRIDYSIVARKTGLSLNNSWFSINKGSSPGISIIPKRLVREYLRRPGITISYRAQELHLVKP